MKNTLNNKLILITGASSGIGAEISKQAITNGARTILVARNASKLTELAAQFRSEHYTASA